jgi:hypothetical protein
MYSKNHYLSPVRGAARRAYVVTSHACSQHAHGAASVACHTARRISCRLHVLFVACIRAATTKMAFFAKFNIK